MHPTLRDLLVCPTCRGTLDHRELGRGDGLLLCAACDVWFPVRGQVPVLLDFATPFHAAFAREHSVGGSPPRGEPRPGEVGTQETFTEEWDTVSESELSFIFTSDELVELNRRVWLHDLPPVATVLDVGCGVGHESRALHKATGAAVVGIDANLALLARRAREEPEDGVHYVVASLFALPFRERSFDLVYSMGVLHHTYSTRAAFGSIAPLSREHVFIWLYGREDHLAAEGKRGVAMRTTIAVERALRPAVARAPGPVRRGFFAAAAAAAHPVLRPRVKHADRWSRADTEMYLRDWLSPRYAYRHGYNEVAEWFEAEGYEVAAVQSPSAYREITGYPIAGVGLRGRRR